MDNKCAPTKNYNDGSCFSLESLQLIAKQYNEQPNLVTDKIVISDNKKEMVDQISNVFSNLCKSQLCWLKLDLIKHLEDEEINDNTFRPTGPLKKYEWLSTTHINDVIKQYEELYTNFVFLGAVPSDFEQLPILGLHNIDFDDLLKNGKNQIGMVINLDTHNQSGSHWVALYADLLNHKLYYFDSVGKKPIKRIKKFNNKIFKYFYSKKNMNGGSHSEASELINIISNLDNKIIHKYQKLIKNKINGIDIRYNNIQHQQENSECGVYSINFILRILKGETFDNIIQNITSDDEVNKCRKVYFR
jgi:hypothetical protein